MNLGSYLKDRLVSIVCWGCALAITYGTLSVTQVAPSVVGLVALVVLFGLLIDLTAGYAGHRRFWQAVAAIASDGDQDAPARDPLGSFERSNALRHTVFSPEDAAQDLPYPASNFERLTDAALSACGRAAANEIARSRHEVEDYRNFVEAWSHEVKTPIHAATLMAASDPSPTGQAIARELERVDAYVEQALYYARSTNVDRDFSVRETALAQMVRDAIHQRTGLLLSQRVQVSLGDLDYQVLCDAKWVRFMVGQLIDNACKYQDPARLQTITFSARREQAHSAHERVVLIVRDEGLGISSQDVPRIFDKGFVGENGRLAGQAASTGIGLYLVKLLAQKTGLAINVSSKVGEGTTFELTFPINRFHYLAESEA